MQIQPPLEHFAQQTARDILKRHAPEYLDRPGLRDAIARLARLGLENSLRLFETPPQDVPH